MCLCFNFKFSLKYPELEPPQDIPMADLWLEEEMDQECACGA